MPAALTDVMQVFPHNLSARQFRVAIKTLVKITSPPAMISEVMPLLPSTLLELVYARMLDASIEPLPHTTNPSAPPVTKHEQPSLSEKTVLILALIDSLPYISTAELIDWLPIVGQSVQSIPDEFMWQICRDRFWDVLTNGEMSIDHAAICATWWSTQGGREMVLGRGSAGQKEYIMSGALGEASKL